MKMVCEGYEKTLAKDSWRYPGETHRDYLNQLVTWGYTPSEVENIILDGQKPAEDEAAAPLSGGNPARQDPATHHVKPGTCGPPPRANYGSHSPAAHRRLTHPFHAPPGAAIRDSDVHPAAAGTPDNIQLG